MANTNKNNKPAASIKKKMTNNSSDQKENRPKKRKIVKPNLNDSIMMSKQLMKKKSSRKSNRSKRKTGSTKGILSNGKPMPSLIDLEKMFEDSDDDTTDSKDQRAITTLASSNIKETQMISQVNITDKLLSPDTHNKILEQAKEILNKSSLNCHDDAKISSPARKLLKLQVEIDESDDLPVLNISPRKKTITDNDLLLNINNEFASCKKKTKPAIELKDNIDKLIPDDGNASDNSLDSNKTIEYNIGTPKLHSPSISHAFCPLPSTSKDNKTFSKNDELFLESLKEINNNLVIEKPSKLQLPETHTATIVIDDEILEEPQIDIKSDTHNDIQIIELTNPITLQEPQMDIKAETHNDIQIIEPTNSITLEEPQIDIKAENHNDIIIIEPKNPITPTKDMEAIVCEDDDCVIIETCTDTTGNTKEPDIIDLEYNFITTETEFNSTHTGNADDEIIDVDALIAQNQVILDKYKKTYSTTLDNTNLVVDVDISTIADNTNDQSEQTANKEQPSLDETPKDVNMSMNVQTQPSNELDLEHISDIRTEISRNSLSSNEPHPSGTECQIGDASYVSLNARTAIEHLNILQNHNRHLFTQHDVSYFFNNFYNPYDIRNRYQPGFGQSITNALRNRFTPSARRQYVSSSIIRTPNPTPRSHKKRQPLITKVSDVSTSSVNEDDVGESHSKSSGSLGDCPICMERLSGNVIASTICGHVFCMSCLQKAIKTNKRCPTCRKILKNNGYHQIFL